MFMFLKGYLFRVRRTIFTDMETKFLKEGFFSHYKGYQQQISIFFPRVH